MRMILIGCCFIFITSTANAATELLNSENKAIEKYLRKTTFSAASYTQFEKKQWGGYGLKHLYSRPEEDYHEIQIAKFRRALQNHPDQYAALNRKFRFHHLQSAYLNFYRREGSVWKRFFKHSLRHSYNRDFPFESPKCMGEYDLRAILFPHPVFWISFALHGKSDRLGDEYKLAKKIKKLILEAKENDPPAFKYMMDQVGRRDGPIASLPEAKDLKRELELNTSISSDVIEYVLMEYLEHKPKK